jgi:hypothetical protein
MLQYGRSRKLRARRSDNAVLAAKLIVAAVSLGVQNIAVQESCNSHGFIDRDEQIARL